MASILTGVVLILVVGGWITFDYLRSKSKLDREHAGVVQSCKIEPVAYVSPLLSTVDMETVVQNKVREVEQLRKKTGRLKSRDTTRVMKPPSSEPQSDTAILKVVVDTAGEAEKAAREKYAKKK